MKITTGYATVPMFDTTIGQYQLKVFVDFRDNTPVNYWYIDVNDECEKKNFDVTTMSDEKFDEFIDTARKSLKYKKIPVKKESRARRLGDYLEKKFGWTIWDVNNMVYHCDCGERVSTLYCPVCGSRNEISNASTEQQIEMAILYALKEENENCSIDKERIIEALNNGAWSSHMAVHFLQMLNGDRKVDHLKDIGIDRESLPVLIQQALDFESNFVKLAKELSNKQASII